MATKKLTFGSFQNFRKVSGSVGSGNFQIFRLTPTLRRESSVNMQPIDLIFSQ